MPSSTDAHVCLYLPDGCCRHPAVYICQYPNKVSGVAAFSASAAVSTSDPDQQLAAPTHQAVPAAGLFACKQAHEAQVRAVAGVHKLLSCRWCWYC
jgi:hypothetical protein